jgi:pimeloyl-ACP methyl ester carboxylesterase
MRMTAISPGADAVIRDVTHHEAMKHSTARLAASLLAVSMLASCSSSEDAESRTSSASPTSRSTPPVSAAPSASTSTTSTSTSIAPSTTPASPPITTATPEISERLLTHPITLDDQACPADLPVELRCGTAIVPLDWTSPNGETIEIWYGVQPATVQPATGTFIPFEGGPSGAISATFAEFSVVGDGMATSDKLYVDVRGVGRSSRLACAALDTLPPFAPPPESAGSDCADEIGPRRDYFNTVSSVLDIESIRRALNLGTPSLAGFSYGTFVASVYTILFPDLVQATVLDGSFELITNRWADDVPRAIGAAAALQCERSGACDPAEFVQQLATVAAELARQPRQIAGVSISFSEGALINMAQYAVPLAFAEFRLAIASAAAGDYAPLESLFATFAASFPAPPEPGTDAAKFAASQALAAAVICNDYSYPYDVGTDPAERQVEFDRELAALADDAVAPFSKAGWVSAAWDHPEECLRWPVPETPNELKAPIAGPFPNVPVLVLNGDLDLQTPIGGAEASAAQFPSGEFIAVENGTHVVTLQSACLRTAAIGFLQTGVFPSTDVCAAEPFVPVLR